MVKVFRHTLSRKDAILVFMGAACMQLYSYLAPATSFTPAVILDTNLPVDLAPLPPPPSPRKKNHANIRIAATTTSIKTTTTTVTALPEFTSVAVDTVEDLPETTIISHAPGWTLYRNLYMSNGTLYIVSPNQDFPEIRLMTSTGLTALNTPENIALREPTAQNMDFLTPKDARQLWGGDLKNGEKNRVWSVEGNTLLFNDPNQFLNHYYHFVAELFLGVWAMWHGAWSNLTPSPSPSHLGLPRIDRAIFPHADTNGWRDGPGFNGYFLRAVLPSITVETEQDWQDRIVATAGRERAWHFPIVLLTDRSAAHRGVICGSHTQRTASEAVDYMKKNDRLAGVAYGGWWEPVRSAMWRFAGVDASDEVTKRAAQKVLEDIQAKNNVEAVLPMPSKVVITYISRQESARRKLTPEDHDSLVEALQDLVARKGQSWELNVVNAEKLTKDEQVQAAAKTTIMLGVHGNGLTHLVFMKPTRVSAVIEMFYPGGFAHDYEWTSRALGMPHYSVWNDTHHTYPEEPAIAYPEGFQLNAIPVHGPTVAELIENHVETRSH